MNKAIIHLRIHFLKPVAYCGIQASNLNLSPHVMLVNCPECLENLRNGHK